MTTRLAAFCDKLLEAGWLAAMIVVPLFFDIYSSRVFEPDKISLLRSIALLMAGVWIVKQIEAVVRAHTPTNGSTAPRPSLAEKAREMLRENPFLLPTLVVVVVYLISTFFSVSISVSLWGSYMRLQGTYTTFSYIVVFLIAASTLRTRAQLDRAINAILATAFPIALYGILQHYKLDPLPWAGDVTLRVASNMGNSIFVAAYLIMVVPLALARWLELVARWSAQNGAAPWTRALFIGIAVVVTALSAGLWLYDFAWGAVFTFALFPLAYVFALVTQTSPRRSLLLAALTNILAALLMTVFFSQSRGPWVGLGAGLFAFLVLGVLMVMRALSRTWRKITLAGIFAFAALVFAFLAVFNLPNSPLQSLKTVPYLGRLGSIFDPNEGTGKVRELIWQGDVPLILPHAPLWAPTTGDDAFNVIRPLVGYGPETMYVAFNRFYPPDLAHHESRNASPDRSHDETFDSLVITGLFGFVAYILIFISVTYFALKWLGAIATSGERNAFVALWLAGGFLSALVFGLWRGWNFIGVALPAGMIFGLIIYLVTIALRRYRAEGGAIDPTRALWLCALLAAIIGHFLEINFGIAIASTRLYFWFYAALLVVIGMNRLNAPALAPAAPRAEPSAEPVRNAQRRRRNRRAEAARSAPAQKRGDDGRESPAPVLAWTAIVTLILVTLAFEFLTNQTGAASALDALQKSLFAKGGTASYGVFILLTLTWLAAAILGLELPSGKAAFPMLLFTVLSFTALLWYALLHLRQLTQVTDQADSLIVLVGLYYAAFFILLLALAAALWFDEPIRVMADWVRSPLTVLTAPLLAIVVAILIYSTNFAGIAADILYKMGQNYDNAGAWAQSIKAYQQAVDLQPSQDFYALFLGRAYLESARNLADPAQREAALNSSEQVLLNALQINPLNTDHSANLARLHRTWASLVDDPAQKSLHLQKSIGYYLNTLRLSPNTAHLHDELALTYMQAGDLASARAQLEQSLQLDQQYAPTFAYLGDYYRTEGDKAAAAQDYLTAISIDPAALSNPDNTLQGGPAAILALPDALPRAIAAYRDALTEDPNSIAARFALAELYRRSNQPDLAQREYEQAAKSAPNDYLVNLALVNFLSESGKIDDAVTAMRHVLDLTTQTRAQDAPRFQDFYNQLVNLQKLIQAAQKSPNDVSAHRNLAALWKARGQPQFALPEYQTVARLAPGDYDAQKNVALMDLQLNHPDDAQAALVAAAALAPQSEKAIWQNLQIALNAQKTRQFDQAIQAARAALALAADADKPAVQAYIDFLQSQTTSVASK
ncbi:MAG: O-antigen ligase family protein [Chloroflexota bacterium]|nr:O-antigen ligase family protein [Chloroflexota bacterium]